MRMPSYNLDVDQPINTEYLHYCAIMTIVCSCVKVSTFCVKSETIRSFVVDIPNTNTHAHIHRSTQDGLEFSLHACSGISMYIN